MNLTVSCMHLFVSWFHRRNPRASTLKETGSSMSADSDDNVLAGPIDPSNDVFYLVFGELLTYTDSACIVR